MLSNKRRTIALILFIVLSGVMLGAIAGLAYYRSLTPQPETTSDGERYIEVVVSGLDHPWDLERLDDGTIFFNQRSSGLYKFAEGGESRVEKIYEPQDLYARGEGGMLGLALSPDFARDQTVFTCFNSWPSEAAEPEVLVARLRLDSDYSKVEAREDILMDMPSARTGRHSGCRLEFDLEGYLWVATGDAAQAATPQDPGSLGGKILRVDSNGKGAPGNPGGELDPRIFSFGHRNSQGIVLAPELAERGYGYGLSAEHGPDVADEINPLVPGNFGWAPKPPYNEAVDMTDTERFPNAVNELWNSGDRTVAASGLAYIRGEQWGEWEGAIFLAALKDRYIMRFSIRPDGELEQEETVVTGYGRIRQVYQASDGNIYFTTDNGFGNDVIARIKTD